jgi:MarR family transcriptional regulator, transcriptional regulator for hemolysin
MIDDELGSVLLYVIDETSKVAKQYSQKEFESIKIGVTVDQWVLLKIIQTNTPLSQIELAVKSHRDPASVTRTLDILESKKLIKRAPIPGNRRQYNIQLTKEGNAFILKYMPSIEKQRSKGLYGFSKSEGEQLKSLLLRIQKNYS